MAIQVLKDMGDQVLIEKDGIRSVVSRAVLEQLQASDTSQAANRNAPPPTGTITPVGAPSKPTGTVTPVSNAPAPVQEKPDAISSPDGGVSITPKPPEVSGKSMTREDYNKSVRQGQLNEQGIAERQRDLDLKLAEEEKLAKEESAKIMGDLDAKRQEERLTEQETRQRLFDEKKAAVEEYANTEIKYARPSTATIILAGIASIAQVKSKRGGENVGVSMINDAIEKDLNLQIANLNKQEKTISQRGGLINDFKQLGDDNEAAYAKAMAASKNKAARDIKLIAARSADEAAKIKYLTAAEKLRKEADAILMQNAADEASEKRADKELRIKSYSARTGRMGAELDRDKFNYAKEENERNRRHVGNARPEDDRGFGSYQDPYSSDVLGYYAHDDKEANRNHRASSQVRAQMAKDLNELKKMAAACGVSYGGPLSKSFLSSKCGREMETRYGQMHAAWVQSISGASVGEEEQKRLSAVLPGRETWTTADPSAAWDETLRRLTEQQDGADNTMLVKGTEGNKDRYQSPVGKEEYSKYINEEAIEQATQHGSSPGVSPEANHKQRMDAIDNIYDYNISSKGQASEAFQQVFEDQVKYTWQLNNEIKGSMSGLGLSFSGKFSNDVAEVKRAVKSGKISASDGEALMNKLSERNREEDIMKKLITKKNKLKKKGGDYWKDIKEKNKKYISEPEFPNW